LDWIVHKFLANRLWSKVTGLDSSPVQVAHAFVNLSLLCARVAL
jgi:hypothetical protein